MFKMKQDNRITHIEMEAYKNDLSRTFLIYLQTELLSLILTVCVWVLLDAPYRWIVGSLLSVLSLGLLLFGIRNYRKSKAHYDELAENLHREESLLKSEDTENK